MIRSGIVIIEQDKLYDKIRHRNHRRIDSFLKHSWKDNIMKAQHPNYDIFIKRQKELTNVLCILSQDAQ